MLIVVQTSQSVLGGSSDQTYSRHRLRILYMLDSYVLTRAKVIVPEILTIRETSNRYFVGDQDHTYFLI